MRIVLAAEEAAGVQVLRRLLALPDPPEIAAVLTTPPKEATRRAVVHEAAVAVGLETLPAALVRSPELAERLRRDGVDLLLNIHSLHIVHPDVVAAPRLGGFNLHPGPLPEYAGLNVPSWAIYNGEPTHGVTVHRLDDGIDTGPIAYASAFELEPSDTGLSVTAKCVRAGIPLLLRLVADAAAGRVPTREQDRSRRRYFRAGPPSDGMVEWNRPAAEIARLVRAADYGPFPSPWGPLRATLGGRQRSIVTAVPTGQPAQAPPGTVQETAEGTLVAAADELLLVVSR